MADTSSATDPRRFPSLVLPFAALGASVGYSAVRLLENPLVDVTANASAPLAAVAGALVSACVGALLTRRGRALAEEVDDGWVRCEPSRYSLGGFVRRHAPLVLTMAGGGVLAGAAVGFASGHRSGIETGIYCGVLVALSALPLAGAVLAAGDRARRARHGSLVATADRRAIWAICAGAAGLASVVTTLDWAGAASGRTPAPYVGFSIAYACAFLVAVLFILDVVALRAVRAIANDGSLRAWERAASASSDAPRVDLGLGDAVQAEVAPGASAYRAMDKERRLVVGSPAEAITALRRALRDAGAALAIVTAVAGLHGLARTDGVIYPIDIALCDARPWICGETAHRAAARGADGRHVQQLLAHGCQDYNTPSCEELGERIASADDTGAPVDPSGVLALVHTCQGGLGPSCHAVVRHARHEPVDHMSVDHWLTMACRAGDAQACEERKIASEAR